MRVPPRAALPALAWILIILTSCWALRPGPGRHWRARRSTCFFSSLSFFFFFLEGGGGRGFHFFEHEEHVIVFPPARALRPSARPSHRCLLHVTAHRNRCEAARFVFLSGGDWTGNFLFFFSTCRQRGGQLPSCQKTKISRRREKLVTAHLRAWPSRPAPATSKGYRLLRKKRACRARIRQEPRGEERRLRYKRLEKEKTKERVRGEPKRKT